MPRTMAQLMFAVLAIFAYAMAPIEAKKPARLFRYISVVRFEPTDDVKYVFDSYNVVKKECVKTTNITRVFSGMDMGLDPSVVNYGVIFVMDFKRHEDAMPYIICMRDSPLMPDAVKHVGHLENTAGYISPYHVKIPKANEIVEFFLYNYADYNKTAFDAATAAVDAGVKSSIADAGKYMIRKREYHGPTQNPWIQALYFQPSGYFGSATFKNLDMFKKYNASVLSNSALNDAKKKYVVGGGRMQFKPYLIKV